MSCHVFRIPTRQRHARGTHAAMRGIAAERGSSLIELLATVLIAGILLAAGIPTFTSVVRYAQDAAAKASVRNVATALEACYLDRMTYADSPGQPCDLQESGATIGSAPGQVQPFYRNDAGYSIVGISKSGDAYWIVRDDTGVHRYRTGPSSFGGW